MIEGWDRPDCSGCFAYVGKPERDFRSASIDDPAPPNMLFVVFVLPDGTIDDWNWRPVSETDPWRPQGFYFRPDRDYSKRLTDHVTLFLSIETDELVGVPDKRGARDY